MKKVSVVVLTAGFLVFGMCDIAQSAQLQKTSEQKTPNSANQPQPAFRPIAIGRQRISREKQTIAILRGSRDVVVNYFTELMIAKIMEDVPNIIARNGWRGAHPDGECVPHPPSRLIHREGPGKVADRRASLQSGAW